MKTSSNYDVSRRGLIRVLAIAAIVITATANGFVGFGVRAAMRLPDEATSLEPWLVPATGIPAVANSVELDQAPPNQDTPRRTAAVGSPKAFADRQRPQIFNRTNKRALAEFMGLVTAPGAEQAYGLPFESFQSCREFVAVNC